MAAGFLSNPDKLFYEIICIGCKKPIWTMRVLKRSGDKVVSTESKKCDPSYPEFSRVIQKCPVCRQRFFLMNKQGVQSYMIRDLNSGITRVI